MKHFYICVFCLLISFSPLIFAQDAVLTTEQIIADIFEQYAAETEDETIDFESFYEELMLVSKNPLNLNLAMREDFEHLPFLTDSQIENILYYVNRFGTIHTLYELQLIEGLDMTDIRRMLPFVFVGKSTEVTQKIYWNDIFKHGRNNVLFRIERGLELKKGYDKIAEGAENEPNINSANYIGSQFYNSIKYHFNFKDRISIGFTTEKDAGEQFLGKINNGFDFYSIYGQLNNFWKFKRIVVGDFRANFGMGLVLHPDFGMGKSAYVLNVVPRNVGLKKFSSTDEYNFFRGIGSTVKLGNFDLTAFYSNKMIDADTSNNTFPSIYKTGYHRTMAEYAKKHVVNQQVLGGNSTFTHRNFQIGLTFVSTHFNQSLVPPKTVYNYFSFSSNCQTTVGLNYRLRWNKLNLFGETAVTEQNATASLNGFSFSPLSTVSFVMLHRYFSPAYDSFYANTFSESTRVNNENGMYLGTEIRPFRKWKFAAYADSYRFPWTKFGVDAPSIGKDFLLQADYVARRDFSMFWRLKYETKENNFSNNTSIMAIIIPIRRASIKYQLMYTFGNFSFKNLIEANLNQSGKAEWTHGITVLQDVSYSLKKIPLGIDFRFQFFDAADYDNRFYTYEKDILYAFSIPMLYGLGSRYYLNLKYELNDSFSIWFKIAQTVYANDRETIGTGNEEIQGDRKTDLRCLLKWEF